MKSLQHKHDLRTWHSLAEKLRSALTVPQSTARLRYSLFSQTALKCVSRKQLQALLFSFILLLGIAGPLLATNVVQALDSNTQAVCEGVGLLSGATDCQPPKSGPTVESVIGSTINILSIVVGVIAVIMIIIGGLKYITSSGDSSNISSAKNTILYAIIGLAVAALAQVIARYVINHTK